MSRAKILIVDDEPFNVDYLEQELAERDCETIHAADGREALEKVKGDMPDLVLLDIMMPVMVISASSDLQNVVKGIQLGAEDYLPKPFEPTLLHARLTSSLEKKRLHDLEQLYLKSLEREFNIARDIQQSFLPSELPRLEGWEIAAFFRAAREVAGDFYDAFLLPDGNLACVIGDVCGKGVGAALFMTLFRSLIRVNTIRTDIFGPQEGRSLSGADRLQRVVATTNQYVATTHADANIFATVFIGVVDLKEGILTYINAGNEPPLVLRAGGSCEPLPTGGPVVGIIPQAAFRVGEVALGKDDLLIAFTDGIPDALNAEGQAYGGDRLARALGGDRAPDALLQRVQQDLFGFIGQANQFDDITLLALRRTG
jgi:sigma-B regulation protein RsbU (phosphoserine phosphatase)